MARWIRPLVLAAAAALALGSHRANAQEFRQHPVPSIPPPTWMAPRQPAPMPALDPESANDLDDDEVAAFDGYAPQPPSPDGRHHARAAEWRRREAQMRAAMREQLLREQAWRDREHERREALARAEGRHLHRHGWHDEDRWDRR
jgi:hypothetical protein